MGPISKGSPPPDDGPSFPGDESYEECPVCRQEFTGVCPITSAECPYLDSDKSEEDEEEAEPDFEDVANVKEVLVDDVEADRLIEEGDELPPEDIEDET
jgi:hypothetical protein